MKILSNENFPLASVRVLKNAGYDVESIAIESPGITDEEVMSRAIATGRLIITFDRDYGELIFKMGFKPASGVIYLRFQQYTPDFPGEFLLELFKKKEIDFKNTFTVIDNDSIRQRKF